MLALEQSAKKYLLAPEGRPTAPTPLGYGPGPARHTLRTSRLHLNVPQRFTISEVAADWLI